MKSFWATLKTELIFHRRFATRHQAMREIAEYIKVLYNRQRLQRQPYRDLRRCNRCRCG